jgi:hypothetical protein
MVKTVVFEGQPHYLANIVKQVGVQQFIVFAYNNRLPVALVKNALELAGTAVAVTAKALDFYCTKLRQVGVTDLPRGMGMKENIKSLSKTRFKASFLVDANMNLMPEMIIDKSSGLFVSVDKFAAAHNTDRKTVYKHFGDEIYQPVCHSMTQTRAAYIIDIENELQNNGWGRPIVKYYQPEKIETGKEHVKTTPIGMLSTSVSCTAFNCNTYNTITPNVLLSAIHIRVAASLFPTLL